MHEYLDPSHARKAVMNHLKKIMEDNTGEFDEVAQL
jgi:hypothetical protein